MYRLNTYPFIHMGFFHAFMNLLALTPLLERFEAEHGTLTAVALFIGRKDLLVVVRCLSEGADCSCAQLFPLSLPVCTCWLRRFSCIEILPS